MNILVIAVEMVIFAILFTVMVFATTGKNIETQVHNYPPKIQEEYFKTHEKISVEPLSKRVLVLKGCAIFVFTGLLAFMVYIAGARSFLQGFGLAFGFMVWIGAYDTFFLDWVLFANMRRFRLEGTEHMDKEYHQKWFHLKGALFPGMVVALIPAALVGVITMILSNC